MNRIIIALVCISLLTGCAAKKAAKLEASKPHWLKERPMDSYYYHGIGIQTKAGSPILYEENAKKEALADISEQISVRVDSRTYMYGFEDKMGVQEYIASRIKTASNEIIEGYEFVDSWEDEEYVYVYLRLSKSVFKEKKAARKRNALDNATLKFEAALTKTEEQYTIKALELYASCIDILSGYMDEANTSLISGEKLDLVTESKKQIALLVNGLDINSTKEDLKVLASEKEKSGSILFQVIDYSGVEQENIPVLFEYTGGYLMEDRIKTNAEGFVYSPSFTAPESGKEETIEVKIDLKNLGRQVTKNLFVRKYIENQTAAKVLIRVTGS